MRRLVQEQDVHTPIRCGDVTMSESDERVLAVPGDCSGVRWLLSMKDRLRELASTSTRCFSDS
jgi:hypothetical protein